jgi:hypothetical protein
MRWLVVSALTLAASACTSRDAARLHPVAAPHVRAFSRIDSWIRRVVTAEAGFVDEHAMEETAFAAVRDTPNVVAAWVERRSTHRRTLTYSAHMAHPSAHAGQGRPEPPTWTKLHFDDLEWLQAAQTYVNQPAVLIAREGRDAYGEVVRITVAFAHPPIR